MSYASRARMARQAQLAAHRRAMSNAIWNLVGVALVTWCFFALGSMIMQMAAHREVAQQQQQEGK